MSRRKRNAKLPAKAFEAPASLRHAVAINPDDPETLRRFRALPAEHPLVRAWMKGWITDAQQFNAGNIYRILFEKANDLGGRDCTQAVFINRSVSGDRATLRTVEMEAARRSRERIERNIESPADRLIVQIFCGKGMPAQAALRAAGVPFHANGVWHRLREALGSLSVAVSRSGVSYGADDGAVAEYLQKTA